MRGAPPRAIVGPMSGGTPQKTNVVRILESMGIAFDVATYPVGEEHVDAVAVARELGVPPEIVWKTLVARDDRERALVFCVPGNLELDQKKAAKAAGARSVRLIPLKELQPLTGYVRGGCSPIGMKKKLPTWLDEIGTTYGEAGGRVSILFASAASEELITS